ncbi:unnamed protein product [Lymnaea stagnalis]|uniref:Uncharacterized protein n=1 Tax=Lymnaea stagnalis TaxID=6523 RepID=A0AAV2I055_LYMST
MFSENLPGVPGNIRRSSRGTYWVGLSFVRHAGVPSSMDTYSNNPSARQRTVYSVDQNTIRSYYLRYGMIVELDATGKPIGSLHDPTGMVINSISEAAENEGLLYITSPSVPYVLRIVLPQGDNRVVTIDSVIQVLRSRCQIPEDKLVEAKAVLTQYISQQTGNSTITPTTNTSPTSFTTATPTITV